MRRVYGLDFGTNNTLIAIREGDMLRLLTENPLPSMLCAQQGSLQRCTRGGITGFKRAIGRGRRFSLGQTHYTAEDLTTTFLRLLRKEFHIPENVPTVLSVPAIFTYEQRILLRNAARKAGWHVERLIDEPSAAVIAGAVHKQYDHASILLVDLGAGTTDASILDVDGRSWRITAVEGTDFGGIDADRIIAKHFSLLGEDYAEEIRRLRERLSVEDEVQGILGGRAYTLTREAFEAYLTPLLEEKLGTLLKRLLESARLKPWDVDVILLTGGFSQTPLIRRYIQTFFQRNAYPLNPYTAVVEGTLLSLGMPREIHRAGIRIHCGRTTLIHPHATLPARGETILTTREDGIETGIIPLSADGKQIGLLRIPLLPASAGSIQVHISLTLFEDGHLHVEAEDLATGRRLHATLMLAEHLREQASSGCEKNVHDGEMRVSHALSHTPHGAHAYERAPPVKTVFHRGGDHADARVLLSQHPDQDLSVLKKRLSEEKRRKEE